MENEKGFFILLHSAHPKWDLWIHLNWVSEEDAIVWIGSYLRFPAPDCLFFQKWSKQSKMVQNDKRIKRKRSLNRDLKTLFDPLDMIIE